MSANFLQRLKWRWHYLTSLPTFQRAPLRTLWRVFAWRMHCWLKIPATVYVPKWQSRFVLSPEWSGAGVTMFYLVREAYEPEVAFLEKFVAPGEIFVDAGANCGVYTVPAAHFVGPKGRVLAFEPGEKSLAMLRKNVALNGFNQVEIFPVALSEKSGAGRLFADSHGASSFTLGPSDDGGSGFFPIETVTLDAVLARQQIPRVDTLKMDVEGAEELILRGARGLFERCRPKVIFEINTEAAARLQLGGLGAWNFLAERGYRFFSVEHDGAMQAITARAEGANVVALHPEAHALP